MRIKSIVNRIKQLTDNSRIRKNTVNETNVSIGAIWCYNASTNQNYAATLDNFFNNPPFKLMSSSGTFMEWKKIETIYNELKRKELQGQYKLNDIKLICDSGGIISLYRNRKKEDLWQASVIASHSFSRSNRMRYIDAQLIATVYYNKSDGISYVYCHWKVWENSKVQDILKRNFIANEIVHDYEDSNNIEMLDCFSEYIEPFGLLDNTDINQIIKDYTNFNLPIY